MKSTPHKRQIELCQILSIFSLVGLMKQVSAAIGPELGVTFIYSLSALLLLAILPQIVNNTNFNGLSCCLRISNRK
jgi:Na+-translocating ferredoxin:NAD+ oxidoreductase RnfA subunit